jgi:hypothetical protein
MVTRCCFEALRTTYKGVDLLKERAEKAHADLSNLDFGRKPKFSAKVFASKFQLCMKRMAESGTAYPPHLIKSTFLAKITHPAYDIFKYHEKMSTDLFEVTFTRFFPVCWGTSHDEDE